MPRNALALNKKANYRDHSTIVVAPVNPDELIVSFFPFRVRIGTDGDGDEEENCAASLKKKDVEKIFRGVGKDRGIKSRNVNGV